MGLSFIMIHSWILCVFLILYHSAFMTTDDHSWSPIIIHDHSSFMTAHDSEPSNVLVLSRSMHHGADIARSCLVKRMGFHCEFRSGKSSRIGWRSFGRWCIEESFIKVDSVDGIAAYSPGFHIKSYMQAVLHTLTLGYGISFDSWLMSFNISGPGVFRISIFVFWNLLFTKSVDSVQFLRS